VSAPAPESARATIARKATLEALLEAGLRHQYWVRAPLAHR
jgi:hypothetical protein